MLKSLKCDEDQATYLEDESLGFIVDCPVCGRNNCLTRESTPIWDLTQVVLMEYLCEECNRLIFILHEDLIK